MENRGEFRRVVDNVDVLRTEFCYRMFSKERITNYGGKVLKDAVKERRTLKSVYCSSCGGWLCNLEMVDGRTIQKCQKCGKRMVAAVHHGDVLVYEDRRGKTA